MKRVQGLPFPKYKQLGYLCTTKHHDKINENKIEQVEHAWELKSGKTRLSRETRLSM
jgi:uncharacterized membrane-anchored protein YitT (DUF2179 family)